MNMHCASRLGWIRSSKEASTHAPEEVTDPAQAGSAASGRATRVMPSRRPADRTLRAPTRHRAKRGGLLLLAAATLLLIPALAYADVPVATITGPGVVKEDSSADYAVTLTLGGAANIIITYEVTGTATEGLDYPAPSGKVTIDATTDQNSPNTTAQIRIAITNDQIQEVGETLVVSLTEATTTEGTVAIGSPNQVTTMIRSADTKLVKVDDASSEEGEPATFSVTLEADATGNATIAYSTANVSATAGKDYTATSGTLTLTGGNQADTQQITVPTDQDDLYEGAEKYNLTLRLANAPDDVALQKRTVTGTITDDDALKISVAADQAAVVEGSAATFQVKLAKISDDMPAGSSAPVVVDYALSGDLDEQDHEESASGTLTIPAGESMGTITVRTVRDDILEGDEELTVTIEKATTGERTVTVPTDGSQTATTSIGDKGRKVTVSVDDISVDEGEEAVFTVSVSRRVSEAVELTTAISGVDAPDSTNPDYAAPESANVTIAADMMTAKFTVQTIEDERVEGPEELAVTLSARGNLPAGVGLSKARGTATIRDADSLEVSIEGPGKVPEGLPAEYTVKLDGGTSTADVTVDYDLGGTAVAGVDYTGESSGSLTIGSGNSMGTVIISTRNVANDAADETLVVTLTRASTEKGAAEVVTPSAVTTTYVPSDTVIVSVKADQATVAEGANGTFTVSLTGGAHSAGLVVNYAVGGSASADDYREAASGTLTFAAERSKTITLNAEADSREEADETVTVTLSLSGQASNVSLGTPTAAAKITDGDTLTASVARIPVTVNEGTDATFTATLSGATSTADVVVEYKVEGAVTAADYSTPSGMLTIPMGASTGVITISTTDDNLPESAEDLTVRLTAATTAAGEVGIATGGGEMASTSIVASDGEILVSVRGGGTVNEGDDAVFTVELSGTLDSNLTVNFATGDGTAEAPGDYTAISNGALTIKAGERSAMITVSTATTPEDTRAENNETFMVTLRDTGLEAANVKIGTVGATATIRDDDPLTVNLSGPKSVEAGDPLNFTVELTGGTGSAVITVTYQEGTNTGTATIDRGSPSADILAASTSGRAGETAVVNLTNVSTGAGTVRRGTSSASTRITHADIVIVSVADPAAVTEGVDIDFTVSRSTGTFTGDVVVRYATATGTAGSADFKALSDTLTISGSDDDDDVTVETEEDTRAENSETFDLTLTLVSPPDGSVELGDDRATATINDDDPLQAAVTRLQTTVLEGSDATFEVALTTGGASGSGSSAVVVSYSVVATVATTADYTEPSGKLTIRAGQSTGTIVIKTTSDNVLESDTALGLDAETLAVRLDVATTSAGTVTVQGPSLATTIRGQRRNSGGLRGGCGARGRGAGRGVHGEPVREGIAGRRSNRLYHAECR